MPIPPLPEARKSPTGAKPHGLRHSLQIDRRENITVTGIVDVISFDEESVISETEMGVIIIKGTNLHVKRISLDSGELVVAGEIDGVTYENPSGAAKTKSLFGKLFK